MLGTVETSTRERDDRAGGGAMAEIRAFEQSTRWWERTGEARQFTTLLQKGSKVSYEAALIIITTKKLALDCQPPLRCEV